MEPTVWNNFIYNSVAVGIPAKVISDKGQEYFNLVTNRID